MQILEVCYKSGVKVVTIYAFSIENFKRSKFEVDALMDMAKVKLTQLAQHGELLERYGARIQVLGQRDLVRSDVIEAMDRASELTKDHQQYVHAPSAVKFRTDHLSAVLNVCFPYTSRHEITSAIRETVRDFSRPLRPNPRRPFSETHITRTIRSRQMNGIPEERPGRSSPLAQESLTVDGDETETSTHSACSTNDPSPSSHTSASPSPTRKTYQDTHIYPDAESITAATLTAHTFTADAPPVDLLIRTSGVQRLSDFMLWQCHEHTSIVFLDCLWPEFDLWQFLPVLVEWQWKQRKADEKSQANDETALQRQKVQ